MTVSAREAKWARLCAEERELSIDVKILGEGSPEAAWLSHWVGRVANLQAWRNVYGVAWLDACPLVRVELRTRQKDTWKISGRAWPRSGRVVISCSDSNAKNLAALVHEIAHIATPGAGHKMTWRRAYAAALTELTGIELPTHRMVLLSTRMNEADVTEAFLARGSVAT